METKIFAITPRPVLLATIRRETPGVVVQKLTRARVRIEAARHVHLFMSDQPLSPTEEMLPTLKKAAVLHRGGLLH